MHESKKTIMCLIHMQGKKKNWSIWQSATSSNDWICKRVVPVIFPCVWESIGTPGNPIQLQGHYNWPCTEFMNQELERADMPWPLDLFATWCKAIRLIKLAVHAATWLDYSDILKCSSDICNRWEEDKRFKRVDLSRNSVGTRWRSNQIKIKRNAPASPSEIAPLHYLK